MKREVNPKTEITRLVDSRFKVCADHILMLQPSCFGYNIETGHSNPFQNQPVNIDSVRIGLEFTAAVEQLNNYGVNVNVLQQSANCISPDAVFLNNWFSTHQNGTLIVYPMESLIRRTEVIPQFDQYFGSIGFRVNDFIDLREITQPNQFLEGTGSLVFNHSAKELYATLSSRTNKKLIELTAQRLDYKYKLINSATSPAVYHTNVMMSVGQNYIVLCDEVLVEKSFLKFLEQTTSKTIIKIDHSQMASFCGNIIELDSENGPVICLSERSLRSFKKEQLRVLEANGDICPIEISNIEHIGGGGIRCMIAENFLPQIQSSDNGMQLVSPITETEFNDYFSLRWDVLRAPWNQPKGSEIADDEVGAEHYMVYSLENELMAVGRIHAIDNNTAQFRYMAVAPKYQSSGVGSFLLSSMIQISKHQGFKNIYLDARENAVDFYLKHGFKKIDKTYLLFGEIQHYSMNKVVD